MEDMSSKAIEILEQTMISLHGKFNEALTRNDFTTIIKYSEAMTAVAKAITEMRSGKETIAMMERTINELKELMKN